MKNSCLPHASCRCTTISSEAYSSYLQCDECQCCKEQTDNPETRHYLRFRHWHLREVDKTFHRPVACLLEMVMQGRHLEYTASLPIFPLSKLEISHLKHHRQVFYKEDKAQQWDKQFLAYQYGKDGKNTADGKTARITHKYLGRECIIP